MYYVSTLNAPKRSIFLSFFFVICLLSISAAGTQAATFIVTTTNGSGPGSLTEAIGLANASGEPDTIGFDPAVFAVHQTIELNEGFWILADGKLTINGPAAGVTLSLANSSNEFRRHFTLDVAGTDLDLNYLTLTGGNEPGGGAIYNRSGRLSVTNSTFIGNSANSGGAIFNTSRSAYAEISNSTFTGNVARFGGGSGVSNNFSTISLTNTTFSGNSADGGGAINNYNGTVQLSNSTVSDNSGGGIGSDSETGRASFTLANSIVANSTGAADCQNGLGFINADRSLIEGGLGCINGTNANSLSGDPLLGPLQDNGGPTKTHSLLPGSPAIDAGSNPLYLSTDQRGSGFYRENGLVSDIGAFESANYLIVNTTAQDDDGSCQPLPGGDCTLREAIIAANANDGTETIIFEIPTADPGYDLGADRYTISLASALPELASNMAISGLGAKRLTVTRSGGEFRIFEINSGATVVIKRLTISGGLADVGGGIKNAGSLKISDSVVRDNKTKGGDPATACDDSATPGGDGAGIYSEGSLVIDSSLFTGNAAGNGGDGGFFERDDAAPCTKRGARGGDGGAISSSGTITIRNSTFSDNSTGNGGSELGQAGGSGAAILSTGSMAILTTTVFNNRVGTGDTGTIGSGVYSSSPFGLSSSIIAGTLGGGPDISGSTFSGTHNITGVDPKLGPLQDNGGPTMTHAVLCGSPAIDAGLSGGFPNDQRRSGFARTFDDPAIANATGGDGTDIGAFELLEALTCNTAPVANDDSYSTTEDIGRVGVAPGVLGNDTDADADSLAASLVTGPANAEFFSLAPDGAFLYIPNHNFNGVDSFTYKASDGVLDSNVATVTITVTPVNDAPVASATPLSQSVQYSDAISSVVFSATDIDSTNLSLSTQFKVDAGGFANGLPAGLTLGSPSCTPSTSGESCTASLTGTASVPAGVYTIRFTASDGPSTSAPTDHTLTVVREDATVTPSATNPASVKVNAAGGTAGPITLCADIGDAADGSPGDIALAVPVTFVLAPVAPGGTLTMHDAVLSLGRACVTFNSVPVNVYDVTITVGGDYYTGSGSSVLAVFDPTLGFTTGGGRVLNPSTGNILHFGFSFKYDKKGFKGQMLVMEHLADGSVMKLKSNSLTSLSIVGNQAIVVGKASILEGSGNLSFRLNVTDNGEPGNSDLFGLKTTTAGGASIPAFSIDPPLAVLGGNIQVPQGAKK